MLRPFQYHRPENLAQALDLLSQKPQASPLAGGTDLLVKMRKGQLRPSAVVDIKGLQECRGIFWQDGYLSLGALTTFGQLLESKDIREHFQALADASQVMGCYEIRQRATLGGNIVNASSGAESGSPLAALEALVELAGPTGQRRLPMDQFWRGPGRTDLAAGELLIRILIPALPKGSRSTYLRLSRVRGMDLASVNVAVVVTDPRRPRQRRIRIALGAVAPTPIRATAVEEMLSGEEITARLFQLMPEKIQEGLQPRETSLRASPRYKKDMVGVLAQMALERLLS